MGKILGTILFIILFTTNLWAEEKLLYAIRYESLQRYPDIVHTKIYSIHPDGKEIRAIFSDEHTSIMLSHRRGMPGHPGEVLVSSKKKIFAHAVEKRLNPGRWYASKASIYELNGDGSNRFKKILDVMGEQSLAEMFVNPAGTRIGYSNYLGQKPFIFIHEAETGKLLHQIDVSRIFLDCFASAIGWLPDGDRVFFSLDTGDVHMTSEESYKRTGAYTIKEDGTDLVRLPENFSRFSLSDKFQRAVDSAPRFVGGLPDGTYIFSDVKSMKGQRGILSFLFAVTPTLKAQKEIPLKIAQGLRWFKLSHSGKSIAFTEKISSREGRFEWVEHIWVKDLAMGEEKKVFSLDNIPFKGLYLGLVGWMGN